MRIARLLTEDGPVTGEYVDGVVHADDGQYVVGRDGRAPAVCTDCAVLRRPEPRRCHDRWFDRPRSRTSSSSLRRALAHEQNIPYPPFTDELTYAGELAAVIVDGSRFVPADVSDAINGSRLSDGDPLHQHPRIERKAFDGSGRCAVHRDCVAQRFRYVHRHQRRAPAVCQHQRDAVRAS